MIMTGNATPKHTQSCVLGVFDVENEGAKVLGERTNEGHVFRHSATRMSSAYEATRQIKPTITTNQTLSRANYGANTHAHTNLLVDDAIFILQALRSGEREQHTHSLDLELAEEETRIAASQHES